MMMEVLNNHNYSVLYYLNLFSQLLEKCLFCRNSLRPHLLLMSVQMRHDNFIFIILVNVAISPLRIIKIQFSLC